MSNSDNSKHFVPRITQLDALFLDREAYSLIKDQLLRAVKYIGQGFLTRLEPEINASLHYFILRYTVQKARSSVGQQLLQIRYGDTVGAYKLQRYIMLLVLGKWAKLRAGDISFALTRNTQAKQKTCQVVSFLEIIIKIAELGNMLVFLFQGIYPSLLQRILGLDQVSASPGTVRKISYSYFTRELLWHGFAELLAFILPLINIQYFHNFVRKLLPSSSEEISDGDDDIPVRFGLDTTCVICNRYPVLPHSFGCQHIACYYCIHSSYAMDPSFTCPLCNHKIESKVQIVHALVAF
ncbi:peroxisome biogenesis factor 2 [Palaemon carinicauda]|uniref:peroxisome biogenesis factor 2 n=1 Tax=Palaemon carinicauda TaxID=392227 RepID=UPI0035B68D59